MLFVLAMDVFNKTIQWLDDQRLLTPLPAGVQRASLYADDLIMLLIPDEDNLLTIKTVLQLFGEASGLFANLDKSVATPIHCTDDDIQRVQSILSCRLESFPSRYLGIPLSIFRLNKVDEQGIVDRVAARIPTWKGNLLTVTGRTELVKATLSAIPALLLSAWAIESIDKLRRAFIWAGAESVAGGKCKVAWEIVCRPRDLGGLGVMDTGQASNKWLRRVDGQRSWSALPDDHERAVVAVFQAATTSTIGDGATMLFWTDNWIDGSSIRVLAPTVFATVPKRRLSTTVADALQNRTWA
jgi:hypothetical protein